MNIRTTICLKRSLAGKLCAKNYSRILRSVHRAIISNAGLKRSGSVRYQSAGENYCKIHVSIPSDLHDVLCEIRWSAKRSVSLILSEALEEILNEFGDKSKLKPDSYPLLTVKSIRKGFKVITKIQLIVNGEP